MLAGLARRVGFIEKLTLRQEAFLAGGEVAKGTYVQMEAEAIGRCNATVEQCVAWQAAQSSVLDHVMTVLATLTSRAEEDVQATRCCMKVEQTARARVEGELADFREMMAQRVESLGQTLEEGAAEAAVKLQQVWERADEMVNTMAKFETMGDVLDSRLECVEDDLDGLRIAVQDTVDSAEKAGKKVGAQGDLLKQAVKDICRLRMQGEGAATGAGGAEEPVLMGQTVSLTGLQAGEFNGQTGTVVGWDRAAVRYEVVLTGGRGKRVRPANLTLVRGEAGR